MKHTFRFQPVHRTLCECIWVTNDEDGQRSLVLLNLDEFDFSQLNAHFMDSLEADDIVGNVFCLPFAHHLTFAVDENTEIYNDPIPNADGLLFADITIKITGVRRVNSSLYPIYIIDYIEYL